ncbi:helix-turn-helix domain-containing protein [Bifidobacterium callitrichidarum]|uniref:XRE family transcriptional regulator n=1 Tax=Bifidobacterium callitrichidarum TaxID=2052941 RepID=A0A2U2N114_9BIFI|nr:helix-turn-helix transcriptional regulator [Bifidobacterium callitrichidarum]PWG62669.1 XRE family transcriptional regulator [Bifidobacterium callitrichidarum]
MPTKSFDDLYAQMIKEDPSLEEQVNEEMARMVVGMQLNDARAKSGLSLDSLSKKSGVAKTTILRIEHGNASPSILTMQKLAKAMGLNFQTSFA